MRKVPFPAVTERSRKTTGSGSFTAKRSAKGMMTSGGSRDFKIEERGPGTEEFLGSGDTWYTCTPLHVTYIFLGKEENKIQIIITRVC